MHTQEFVLFILSELVFVSRKKYPGNKNKSKKNKKAKLHLSKVALTFFCYFWLIGSFFILKQTDHGMTLVFFYSFKRWFFFKNMFIFYQNP